MSHTLRKINLGNTALIEATILDYVQGGEAFTLAELGLTGAIVSTIFLTPPKAPVCPVLTNNKVVLNYTTYGNLIWFDGTEIPTQTGVNFTFVAIVHGT